MRRSSAARASGSSPPQGWPGTAVSRRSTPARIRSPATRATWRPRARRESSSWTGDCSARPHSGPSPPLRTVPWARSSVTQSCRTPQTASGPPTARPRPSGTSRGGRCVAGPASTGQASRRGRTVGGSPTTRSPRGRGSRAGSGAISTGGGAAGVGTRRRQRPCSARSAASHPWRAVISGERAAAVSSVRRARRSRTARARSAASPGANTVPTPCSRTKRACSRRSDTISGRPASRHSRSLVATALSWAGVGSRGLTPAVAEETYHVTEAEGT